ncbi:MAG: 3'-5' exonuclease, partial [Steroidobacteraceae bacterium]
IDAGDAAGETRAALSIVRRVRAETPGRSIAILVAARPHASAIAAALREARIPAAGVDLVPLAEVPVVRDLAALARAIDHLGDRTSWLAVLRAPWCGFTLRDLTALVDRTDEATVWEAINDAERVTLLPFDAQQRLGRTRAALGAALAARGNESPAPLLEAAWMRLGGPAACAFEGELAHAERFFEKLAIWSAEPDWIGAEGLAERLATLYANDSGATDEAVQVMTIHRAKGLEFDVVILPGLGRAQRSDTEPLLRWLELPGTSDTMDLLVAPITPRGAGAVEPLNAYLRSLQARRAAHERSRVLYVAATRPRHELHLLCELPPTAAAKPSRPRAGTLLASLWPAISAQIPSVASRAPQPRAAGQGATALRRLSADWKVPEIVTPQPGGAFVVGTEPMALPEFDWATNAARRAGKVVHEQLREFGRRNAVPNRADVLAARDAIARRLGQLGLADSEVRRAQARVIEALLACANHPRGRWLFAPEHRDASSPLELTGILDGRLVDAAVDRSFIDRDGIRWLVDFKIGVHREDGIEEFIASEVARYRPQLERTVALASRLGPEPPRAALFFPLLGVFREL